MPSEDQPGTPADAGHMAQTPPRSFEDPPGAHMGQLGLAVPRARLCSASIPYACPPLLHTWGPALAQTEPRPSGLPLPHATSSLPTLHVPRAPAGGRCRVGSALGRLSIALVLEPVQAQPRWVVIPPHGLGAETEQLSSGEQIVCRRASWRCPALRHMEVP